MSSRPPSALEPAARPRVAAAVQGRGALQHGDGACPLRPGESLVLPPGAGPLRLIAGDGPLVVLLVGEG